MATSNHIFSAFAFLSSVLVLIPFPWHLRGKSRNELAELSVAHILSLCLVAPAWNTGTCIYMAWTGVTSFIFFIHSVVWDGNTVNWVPVWCDISTKIIIGASVAIPATTLCINRRLYIISSMNVVTTTKAEKKREIITDIVIGFGIPLLTMALHYIVQGHRFNIFEDIGCFPFTFNVLPAYFIIYFPPLALIVVSGIYSILSIVAFMKRQSELRLLLSSKPDLDTSRYLRLIALAGTGVAFSLPIWCYAIYLSVVTSGIIPWISWKDTHDDFSRVNQVPGIVWRGHPVFVTSLELSRWLVVACGLIFFALFGFAEEARKNYKLAFQFVARHPGFTMSWASKTLQSTRCIWIRRSCPKGGVLPVSVRQEVILKRDSCDTLEAFATLKDVSGFLKCESGPSFSPPFSTIVNLPLPSLTLQRKNATTRAPLTASSASMYSTSTASEEYIHPPELGSARSSTFVSSEESFLDLSTTPPDSMSILESHKPPLDNRV